MPQYVMITVYDDVTHATIVENPKDALEVVRNAVRDWQFNRTGPTKVVMMDMQSDYGVVEFELSKSAEGKVTITSPPGLSRRLKKTLPF